GFAHRAAVDVGVVRLFDPRGHDVTSAELDGCHLPLVRKLRGRGMPPHGVRRFRRWRIRSPPDLQYRRGLDFTVDHDAGEFRRGRPYRLFDRQAHRYGRRGTSVATAGQPQPSDPVRVDAEEGHTPGVRAEVGPDPVQCGFDAFIHGQRV